MTFGSGSGTKFLPVEAQRLGRQVIPGRAGRPFRVCNTLDLGHRQIAAADALGLAGQTVHGLPSAR
jgi:hypothetical protein